MGKSSELFIEIRERELTLPSYAQDVTKKEITKQASVIIQNIKSEGNTNLNQFFSNVVRYKTFFDALESEVREILPKEKHTAFGIEIVPTNGRQIIQYADDPVYAELLKQLKEREELLKVALKQSEPLIDAYLNEVPKVSVKYAKDSLTIKF